VETNSLTRGPCVLTQTEEFKEKFKYRWRKNPSYFKDHSLAYILFDEEMCYGLGEYSVSEILCRLHYSYNVKPWDNALDSFRTNETNRFLDAFLEAPRMMLEEQKLYWKNYNPALFRKEQRAARREFRINFCQVYGKEKHENRPVYSFALKSKQNLHSIWTFCFENKEEVPPIEEVKSSSSSKRDKNSELVLPKKYREEDWFRYSGRIITKATVGIGPHDWHTEDLALTYEINREDFELNVKKRPAATIIDEPPSKKPRISKKNRESGN